LSFAILKQKALWVAAALLLSAGVLIFTRMQQGQPGSASLSSPKQTVQAGKTVTMPIYIDTGEHTVNAAEVYLKFDPKLVQVESVSKDNSIFSIWISDQPAFNNQTGEISFAGGIPTPGFKGQGQVGSVTLKANQPAKTQLTFDARTQVLLNDGLGTAVQLRLSPIEVNIK
jgi:hypothetical protein